MPSPPPPYSPGQNPNISQALGSSPHLSSNGFPQHPPPPPPPPTSTPSSARPISGFQSRPGSMVMPQSATSVTSNPQFPPPPSRNGPGRSASRDKLSTKFSLSSFRNRNSEHSPAPSAIESLHISTSDAIQRAPASPGLVAQRASSQYDLIGSEPLYICRLMFPQLHANRLCRKTVQSRKSVAYKTAGFSTSSICWCSRV